MAYHYKQSFSKPEIILFWWTNERLKLKGGCLHHRLFQAELS